MVADKRAPVAVQIGALTEAEERCLDSLGATVRRDGRLDKVQQQALLTHLAAYRKNVVRTFDSIVATKYFRCAKQEIAEVDSSLPLSKDSGWLSTDQSISHSLLHQLKNDLALSKSSWIRFCDRQTLVLDGSRPSPVVMASGDRVRPGQPIEIVAGMVQFMSFGRITVKGKTITPNDDGMTMDTVVAANRPGKYELPGTIEVLRPDGSLGTISKKLNYTVEKVH